GGDGTVNETVNGLFDGETPRNPEVVFTVVPAGTGSDLKRTLRIPKDTAEAMAVAAHGETRSSDVAALRFERADGSPGARICVNVAGIGLNGQVVDRANRSSKRLGGKVTFLAATVQTLATYSPSEIQLRWTDEG